MHYYLKRTELVNFAIKKANILRFRQKVYHSRTNIRDQISALEKRLQFLKNHQYSNRTKTGEIKKINFSKKTLQTQAVTSLTRDLQTVQFTEILYGKIIANILGKLAAISVPNKYGKSVNLTSLSRRIFQ